MKNIFNKYSVEFILNYCNLKEYEINQKSFNLIHKKTKIICLLD